MQERKQKQIINNSATDPNKILPLTYPWARTHYKTGVANNWGHGQSMNKSAA